MPVPSPNQGAACFLVELGNGDKFIFDMGTGSSERLWSLGIPLDYINKVFIGHLHMDHMGDLPAFWIYGPQNNRSGGINVWGPGGGGTKPEWGMKASMEHMQSMWAWMTGTLVGTIDTRAHNLSVTEFDWSKVNNVIYEENGVVIRTIPAIHFEQSVSFILEWNGLKLSYSSDTVPNKWWAEYTKGSDLSIHEAFFPTKMWAKYYGFSDQEALNASTVIHTSGEMFGKIMSITKPRQAVAYHFTNTPDSLPQVVDAVRETYDGPVDFATDFMVWNVTKDSIRTRLAAVNKYVYPVPPLEEKQITTGVDRYRTPGWIQDGLEPDVLPVIQKIYDDFNEERGTDFKNPLAE
jgi:ribonuclease Z